MPCKSQAAVRSLTNVDILDASGDEHLRQIVAAGSTIVSSLAAEFLAIKQEVRADYQGKIADDLKRSARGLAEGWKQDHQSHTHTFDMGDDIGAMRQSTDRQAASLPSIRNIPPLVTLCSVARVCLCGPVGKALRLFVEAFQSIARTLVTKESTLRKLLGNGALYIKVFSAGGYEAWPRESK
jgi:hypothetical protein